MDRYVYSSVQEESSAAVLVQVQYIYSHKLPSRKTAPEERPRDTTVSVLVLVRGATVDFRPPPVLCRMMTASPVSFASLKCTTASGETCSCWSHIQSLALELSPTVGRLGLSWPLHNAWALHGQGRLDAGGRRRKLLQIVTTSHLFC